MSFLSKLFKKNTPAEEEPVKGSVEEFVSLIRVYYQGAMAMNLGITNLNILPDLALFKRMLKIPTQNNRLGVAEKARVRKVLMQDYGLQDYFSKEMDASVKKCCRTQLTGYKIPHVIVFADSLPKTAVGKILRRELKDIQ